VTATTAALGALLIQAGLFALLWMLMAVWRMARRATTHWALGLVQLAVGLSLVVQRDTLPRWLGFWFAAMLVYVGFWLMHRGVAVFARAPLRDAALAVGAFVYAVALALALGHPSLALTVLMGSTPLGLVLLLIGWTVQRSLAAEFGQGLAKACAVPYYVIGALLALRGPLAFVMPQAVGGSLHHAGAGNLGAALMFVGFALVLNLSLVALVIVRMLRRLQRASLLDPLTGLLNRRGIEQRLGEQMHLAARTGQPLSVLSIDIDHFKRVNDRHGHPAGDAALQALGQTLAGALRESDHAARVGGEEFWVVLPATGMGGAHEGAQRVLQAVRALRVPIAGAEPLALTVSIGVVTQAEPGETMPALMRRLDAALYRAKDAGRDRIEVDRPIACSPG
jgi:diguanylate cyclase (GGDEF)-like protein